MEGNETGDHVFELHHDHVHHHRAVHAFDIFEKEGELIVMVVAGLFLIAFILANVLHSNHISCLPESLVVICIGAAAAATWQSIEGGFTVETDSIINKKFLNMVWLPIIIFEAGWALRNKEFIAQLPYIIMFAVLGTIICMIVVAGLIMASSNYHAVKSTRLAFTYGALIAAVDPVATLATYAHLNVDPVLNILVMGESIINDAVAIVLFEVLNDEAKPYGYFGSRSLYAIIWEIVLGVVDLLGSSVIIGLVLGGLFSFVLRVSRMRDTANLGILFVVVCAYFTYSFADYACDRSGIIAVLFCGMMMSATAGPHLTAEGALLTSFILKQLAALSDMSVFMFVGFALIFIRTKGLIFGCFVMLFCMVGRACSTFPLAILSNFIKAQTSKDLPKEKQHLLSWKKMFMMWHAGLRGGIALVLTLDLGAWVDDPRNGGVGTREVCRNATVLLICVFLLVFGGTTTFFLKCLDIPYGNPPPMYLQGTRATRCMYWIHRTCLKPLLKGYQKKDLRMKDSVIQRVIDELEMKRGADVEDSQNKAGQSEQRWDLFGRIDPVNLDRTWSTPAADVQRDTQWATRIDVGCHQSSDGSTAEDGSSSDE